MALGTFSRSGRWVYGFLLASIVTIPLAAQEPAPTKPADASRSTATAAVETPRVNDPTRRVPPYFAQIGLTPEEKEQIYQVRGKHQPRIEALQKQIAQIQAEMLTECEAVLSDAQKQLLTTRRESAKSGKTKVKSATHRSGPVEIKEPAKSSD